VRVGGVWGERRRTDDVATTRRGRWEREPVGQVDEDARSAGCEPPGHPGWGARPSAGVPSGGILARAAGCCICNEVSNPCSRSSVGARPVAAGGMARRPQFLRGLQEVRGGCAMTRVPYITVLANLTTCGQSCDCRMVLGTCPASHHSLLQLTEGLTEQRSVAEAEWCHPGGAFSLSA
jgi:hypothetical protein